MNAIFSFNRFGYYGLRKLLFSKSLYLYIIGLIAGCYLFSLLLYVMAGITIKFLCMGLISIFIYFAPFLFEGISNKYEFNEYTFPVSNFERFSYIWLCYAILIPGITLGFYFILNTMIGSLPLQDLTEFSNNMHYSLTTRDIHSFLGIQSIFLLGKLSFQKNAFFKTILTCMLIAIVITFTGWIFPEITETETGIHINRSLNFTLSLDLDFLYADGKTFREKVIHGTLAFLLPVGLWIISFFKIREKEI